MRTFQTEEQAIRVAKSRAKTQYQTQYVYPVESGFHVRQILVNNSLPIIKVRYDGGVIDLRKEQAQ